MASKVKVKNKGKKVAEQLESNTVEERPGSAHSQISVKEAAASVDNTEKFAKDEHVNEKESNKNRTETPTLSGKSRIETPTKSDKGKTDTPTKSDRGKTNTPTKSEKSPATKRKSEKVDYGYKKKHEPRSGKNIRKEEMDLPQRTPSPAPSLTPSMTPSERQKRASPFRNNTVEPVQGEPMGSSASLKSHSTFREAWIDRSDAGSEFNADTVSQLQNTEEDEVAKNAYIPYLYARKCIANIMGDMTKMKICHVRIVEEIQTQYKSIENETQSQFNVFVVSLRQQYHDKVQTFRQVIDVHRSELQSKESYWNEMLASLAERNKRLLRDKKVLLIQNKVEIDRLEKEKVEMQTDLSQKLDKANALVVTAEKEKAEEKEKESHTHSTEVKSLQDQLESEKSNVKDLQDELAKLKVAAAAGVVVAATDNESERKETKLSEVPDKATKEDVELQKGSQVTAVAAVAGVTSTDKKKMSEERNQMEGERQKMLDERDEMEKDRENFGTERKVWLDEINMLQLQLTEQSKESAEWKAKYEAMKTQAGDSLTLKSKYKALEDQYNALAVVVAASEGTKELAQENAKKTESDKEMMTKEKSNIDNQIKQWETKFKKKNGREPTEDDKSDSVKEMYVQQEELTTMVTSLDKQLETFQKLENGKVPDPPEVPPVPVAIKDPEVQTVEVRVPDPVILEELKKAHEDIAKLRVQISTLQQENTECHSQISQQNEELSRQRDRISQLEAEIAVLKAGALTATVSDEELEKTKKENRDLKKDMKKLLKRMETLEEKAKTADVDPDTRVTDLEGKVLILNDKTSELESENEALKEDKIKMERDNENFQAQIYLLQQQIETSATQSAAVTVTPVAATLTRSQPGEDKDGCNIPEHADLLEQLEIKKQELENMELELQKKETVISEKILTIQDKEEEIEKLKKETKQMRADMIKMTKQHVKLQQKLKDMADYDKIKKLIEALGFYVHEIHQENPEAAEGVNKRLEAVSGETLKLKEQQEKSQKAVDAWVAKYKQKHGKEPTSKDRDAEGEKLYKLLDENTKLADDKKIMVEALNIMKTGDYKSKQNVRRESVTVVEETTVENIEKQMSVIDTKVTVLETENDELRKERNEAVAKMKELELQVQQAQRHAEQSMLTSGITDSEELSKQISELQKQVNASEAALLQERNAHDSTKDELENLRKQMDVLREEVKNEKSDVQAKVDAQTKSMAAEMKAKDQEIKTLQSRNEQLEMERLANVPVDTAKEIQNLQNKIIILEKEKSTGETTVVGLQGQIAELKTKLEGANKNLEAQRAANRDLETKNKTAKADKEKALRENTTQIEKREQQRANEDKKRIGTLEKKIRELEAVGARPTTAAVVAGGKDTVGGGASKDQLVALKRENNELKMRIKQLENEIKQSSKFGAVGVSGADDRNEQKRKEKILKELERKYEIEKNKTSKLEESVKSTEEELKVTKKEADVKDVELKKLAAELAALGAAAKQGVEAATKVKTLETDNKKLTDENKVLTENYNTERVLRKKYYNMVEDMKGKIRVYCRARPLSSTETDRGNYSVLRSPDEFSINVDTQKGTKEFQFDAIFMEDSSQEKVFEDTNNLIQSAIDGYNVCIFAYGQTGSGKTFTMIGDRQQQFPGIAPRAFKRIFELIHELRNKFTITVSSYMLELYNEKLIDLYAKPGTSDDERMEIKKDKKGLVFVQGAIIKTASNDKELFALFEEGSKNRHTASTKMNSESSRSHLVVGITMEVTNKTTGQVLKGKLSLVDLAGSERVGKTGATAEQLKEAMSINKSLSALGDVISALSSDQQFIPYRNNKLTMLMQDSLGGNAKTLMFVNISPADYNQDETVISLMYASRVKLITNDASKNADNKEIARLKAIIAKLRAGESIDEEV